MDEKQEQAIKKLQYAFGLCKKAKLEFVGCDSNLICVPSGTIDRIWGVEGKHHGVGDIANSDEAVTINTKGTYIDSGGA